MESDELLKVLSEIRQDVMSMVSYHMVGDDARFFKHTQSVYSLLDTIVFDTTDRMIEKTTEED